MSNLTSNYNYSSADPTWSNSYLWPPLKNLIVGKLPIGARVLDVGCGAGATAGMLADLGFQVVGVDPSSTGIFHATKAFPRVTFAERSAYDDLSNEFGQFDAVISLEVVEHCYLPRSFAANILRALKPGGFAVISTPFHGYWKNLAIALAGRFDEHWSPLWDGGHMKFWSEKSMYKLLNEAGFGGIGFSRVGRIPALAKSMLVTARKDARQSGG